MYAKTQNFGTPQAATGMPSQPQLIRPGGLFAHKKMSGFLQDADGSDLHDMSSVIEGFQKKNSVGSMGSATTAGNHMASSKKNTSSSSSSSRTMESSSSTSSSSSSSQHVLHRQVSEMMTTSSELQNSQLLQQRILMDGGDVTAVNSAVAEDADCCNPVDGADPLVTFPESPPVLMSNVSPLLNASATRPKPVRVTVQDARLKHPAAATAATTERRVSTVQIGPRGVRVVVVVKQHQQHGFRFAGGAPPARRCPQATRGQRDPGQARRYHRELHRQPRNRDRSEQTPGTDVTWLYYGPEV
ncbi:unnamed protein product [Macrosiphum euphorbiae]|uniref:Uncharacterized protein n=1 Tax=Macrosiphum euphorbiae TaxID=13131 RepID=A0AAV0XA35_9HEMI|nr:unnamed protein product [Macrosiphum euphorbiae]